MDRQLHRATRHDALLRVRLLGRLNSVTINVKPAIGGAGCAPSGGCALRGHKADTKLCPQSWLHHQVEKSWVIVANR